MRHITARPYLLLIVSLLSANTRAIANTLEFANGQTLSTEQINPQETINNFQFGMVKVTYTSVPVTNLKLGSQEDYKIISDAIFVKEAHAATTPLEDNVFNAARKAQNALRSAVRFKDVKPYLSKSAYESLLSQKQASGGKEIMILQMIKSSIPEEVEIVQTQSKGDLSWAVASGQMNGRKFWGVLSLVKEDGDWKLAEQTWYGQQHRPVFIPPERNADDFIRQVNGEPDTEFIKWVDRAGQPKTNLPLQRGKIKTSKRAFCFFFFLDPDKTKQKSADENGRMVEEKPSPDLHVVWPSGLRHDPQVYEGDNDEGFDVSVAADKDGYYPNKMNLRLPRGKPREAYVGFLMSF